MTIRLSCKQGHAQDLVINPSLTGNNMVALFLNRYKDEVAALLDGSSKLYVVKPTPRRCQVGGCQAIVKAQVVNE